jgi:hypothetical protein
VQFTASRELRDKLQEAQDLMRHQLPNGDLAVIVDRAVTLLIGELKKARFGLGRKPRAKTRPQKAGSRHVPDEIKRAVYERDGGQCTFVDDRGRRCPEKGRLQIDHVEGFARNLSHSIDGCRLLCSGHNHHAAEKLYGKEFMKRKRAEAKRARSQPLPGEAGGA